jgi:hypothetical protein
MESPMKLSEIQEVMSSIEDGHIMEETVNYYEKYTGERWFNSCWESEGKEEVQSAEKEGKGEEKKEKC